MIRVFLLLLFLAGCVEGHAVLGSTAGSASAGYSYDDVGNRLTRSTSGFTPGTLNNQSFAFDPNDRLNTDTYDANGNTLFGAGFNQTQADRYDFENRLVERRFTAASITRTVNLAYDGDGQRVRKTVGGVTTHYLVDDLNPTGYAQVVEELTSTGGGPVVTRTYAWGHMLLAQDQLFDTGTNFIWQASFYGYDGQGSVRYLTDGTGNITDTFDYDAFGNLLARTGTTPNNYLYQSEQYDHDLGLYYLRARYADPDRGRFWTMDSFEGFGTDPASFHKYTFNHNDPINRRDPSGHFSLTENLVVTTLAPLVRGALLRLQQSFLTCRLQSAFIAGGVAGGISGTVGGIISEIAQVITTGTIDGEQVIEDASKAFGEGFLAGFSMGFNPFTAWAYVGYANINAGLNLFNVWNDPEAGPVSKGLAILEQVTALVPVLAPSLVKKLQQLLQILCFPAGTQIATAEGQKPIEELAEGDLVWAQSDQTGEISLRRAKQVFANVAAALVVLHCGTNTLEATPEHPVWVADQGWKAAGQIQAGDELWTRTGERIAVTGIERKVGQFTVYNFTVEDFHSYYVGAQAVLAHNDCKFLWFGKLKVPSEVFHRQIKPSILEKAGKYWNRVGNNPDVKIVGEKIVLTGTGPFKGKSLTTDLLAKDFFIW